MSFPECLNVTVSNAEYTIFQELQHRGLTTHLITQYGIELDPDKDHVYGTRIDFYWTHPHNYAVYIDGNEAHSSRRQLNRDNNITQALERRGIKVSRFLYRTPLRKTRLTQIVDRIEHVLNGE